MGLIFGMVMIIGSLTLTGGVSAATPISSCTTISSPDTYVLNQDISSSGTCITIESSDVVFDGRGYGITGPGSTGNGVYVYKSGTTLTNVTVGNVTVTGWSLGIIFRGVENASITNNTANSNKNDGIHFMGGSNYNNITGNDVSNNSKGIYFMSSSSYNTIQGNNVSNNGYGVLLNSSSSYNAIADNTANLNQNDGIHLMDASNYNNVTDNTVFDNGNHGIRLHNYNDYNTLTNNTVNSNALRGIDLTSSSSNAITDNAFSYNKEDGISLYSSSNNTIRGNTAFENGWGGIYLHSSGGNVILGNNASNNVFEGISLYSSSSSNVIKDNIAMNSYNLSGIYVGSSSNSTVSGNTIAGNNLGGIYFYNSNNNTITDNTASNNNLGGIYLKYSNSNNVTDNTASNNSLAGIYLNSSSSNAIYDNFLNNTDNSYDDGSNSWNATKTPGTNIVGGPYLGGNFWADPDGTGFSQTCIDTDDDGICDTHYNLTSGNTDQLPLKYLPVKNLNTGLSYSTIQKAIDAINTTPGHTIRADAGTYTENVDVDKSVNLIGAGEGVSIIKSATANDHVFNITGITGVNISGFTIKDAAGAGNAGIYMENASYNAISNVIISNNSRGIIFNSSGNNTVSGSTIFGNARGIYLNGPSNNSGNLIYDTFFFNTNNAYDNGTNAWNATNSTGPNVAGGPYLGGNFWSDYVGNDSDGDGFGDAPYNIPGGPGVDYLPLVDTTPSNITINSPINGTTFNTGSIDFDMTVSEPINTNASVLVYYLDVNTGPLQILLKNDLQNPYRWYNNTITLADYGYGEGGYNATFDATDLSGNSNSSTVYFSVDTTRPNVTIHSPGNRTYPGGPVDLNYTLTDNSGGIYWAGYSLDGATNVTLSGNTTLTNLPDGQHSLTVYARDSAGNTGSSTAVYFLVDDSIIDMFEWNINTTQNNATTGEFTDAYPSKYVDMELGTGNRSVSGYINVTVHDDTPFSINPLNSNYGLGSGESRAGMFVKFTPGGTLDSNSGNLKWVTFRLNYTSVDLRCLVENSLRFYWYNDTSGSGNWIKLTEGLNLSSSGGPEVYGTGINTSGKYVWANLSRFSVYGLAANATSHLTGGTEYKHRLGIMNVMPLVKVVIPGTQARFQVIINNLGDFAERGVRIGIPDLPKGWRAEDVTTDVGYKKKARIILPIHVPADAKEGETTLTFKVIPGDFIGPKTGMEKQVGITVDKTPPLAADVVPAMSVLQNVTTRTTAPRGTEVTKGAQSVTPQKLLESPAPAEGNGNGNERWHRKSIVSGLIGILVLVILAYLKRKSYW